MSSARPRILIVAGHDPSGAGVDADRDALAGLEVEVRVVVTAWTRQTNEAVLALGARPVEEWLADARAEIAAGVAAIKFGLLPGRAHVRAAAELVREVREAREARVEHVEREEHDEHGEHDEHDAVRDAVRVAASADRAHSRLERPWVVVDPVLASSSRGRFLDDEGAAEYGRSLLPEGVVLTPNLDELAELAGSERAELARDLERRLAAAGRLLARGARAVLVKGGHGEEDPVCDLLLEPGREPLRLEHPRVIGGKIRGSGCRYASRLAGALALGASLEQAAREAAELVRTRLGGVR